MSAPQQSAVRLAGVEDRGDTDVTVVGDTPPSRVSATDARRTEVERLLEAMLKWASARHDVRGLALVGSWARGTAHMESDVDLVLLTLRVERYTEADDWIRDLGCETLERTTAWGALMERRLRMPSGLEVELGVVPPYWAAVYPVDSGTRSVVEDGMRVLHDPDGLLRALARILR
jgi:predicted nucleotidyltransferase